MQIKLQFLNPANYKLIVITFLSFVAGSIYFFLLNNIFNFAHSEIITFIFLFFQNFFLLIYFKLYTSSANSLLIIALISFSGRCLEVFIYYFLKLILDVEHQLVFILTLLISNFFKFLFILKYKNSK
jgi:hypothetical protein